jgi:hypothetical protein
VAAAGCLSVRCAPAQRTLRPPAAATRPSYPLRVAGRVSRSAQNPKPCVFLKCRPGIVSGRGPGGPETISTRYPARIVSKKSVVFHGGAAFPAPVFCVKTGKILPLVTGDEGEGYLLYCWPGACKPLRGTPPCYFLNVLTGGGPPGGGAVPRAPCLPGRGASLPVRAAHKGRPRVGKNDAPGEA